MAIKAAATRPPSVAQGSELHAAITRYTRQLGWPLVINADGVFIPANLGIVGLTLPAGLAGEVNTEIKRRDIGVPIIAVPGKPCRWVFLVEPPAALPSLPVNVGLISGAARIPLPPTELGGAPTRWICAPGAGFVHVPEFRQVLQAVRHITSPRTP